MQVDARLGWHIAQEFVGQLRFVGAFALVVLLGIGDHDLRILARPDFVVLCHQLEWPTDQRAGARIYNCH